MVADENTRIVANAARLLSDAKLLKDAGRHASAFALSTIALEELGKLILRIWTVEGHPLPKGRTSHIRKQLAVSSLLAAKSLVEAFDGEVNAASGPAENLEERVAQHIANSGEGRRLLHTTFGFVEAMKHLALYRDEASTLDRLADDFKAEDAEHQFEICRAAIGSLSGPHWMTVARAMFVAEVSGPDPSKAIRPALRKPPGSAA